MSGRDRRRKWNRKGKGKNRGRGSRGKRDSRDAAWVVERANEAFEKFYRAQGIVPEGEWEAFMEALRRELPVTFRISAIPGSKESLLQQLKTACFGLARPEGEKIIANCQERDEKVQEYRFDPPRCVNWYPDGCMWYFQASRRVLRKSPELRDFHNFLVRHDLNGDIVRQEAVSMIPPLLMEVQPDHVILDMCAAPGSKTSQLLEALYVQHDAEGKLSTVYDSRTREFPKGVIIANDNDPRRAHMLSHRLKPLGSPNFLVVSHDGQFFPNIYRKDRDEKGRPSRLLFDRILCDVPCSGDGTLRKNPSIWADWTHSRSAGLHDLQLSITRRGADMLKPDGLMVYSTCSMSPHENEAVVAAVLHQYPELELVDVSDKLTGLKRMPGLRHWKVFAKDWTEMPSPDAEQNEKLQWSRTMWPPPEERAKKFNLERCVRILPHHQDTGGFFIALLRKNPSAATETEEKGSAGEGGEEAEEAKVESEGESDPSEGKRTESPEAPERKLPRHVQQGRGHKRKPADDFFPLDEDSKREICGFYGLEDFDKDVCFTRDQGSKIYYIPPVVREILEQSFNDRLKIVNSGTRIFEAPKKARVAKGESSVPRLVQEGVHLIHPFMTKQTVQAGWDLFLRLLDCHYDKPLAAVAEEDEGKNDPGPPSKRQKQTPQPRAKASKIAKVIRLTELESDDPDFATGIKEQAPGYVLVGLTDPRAREVSTRPIVMVCRWTGLSVACMASQVERQGMHHLLTGYTAALEEGEAETRENPSASAAMEDGPVSVPSKRVREE